MGPSRARFGQQGAYNASPRGVNSSERLLSRGPPRYGLLAGSQVALPRPGPLPRLLTAQTYNMCSRPHHNVLTVQRWLAQRLEPPPQPTPLPAPLRPRPA